MPRSPTPPAVWAEIERLRADGMSVAELAERFGMKRGTISSRLSRARNAPAPSRPASEPARNLSAAELTENAAEARREERGAREQVAKQLRAGKTTAAHSAERVAASMAGRAQSEERAAREVEAHDAAEAERSRRMADNDARLFQTTARVLLRALGIPWGQPMADALAASLAAISAAERDERGQLHPAVPDLPDARAVVQRAVARQLGSELPPAPAPRREPNTGPAAATFDQIDAELDAEQPSVAVVQRPGESAQEASDPAAPSGGTPADSEPAPAPDPPARIVPVDRMQRVERSTGRQRYPNFRHPGF